MPSTSPNTNSSPFELTPRNDARTSNAHELRELQVGLVGGMRTPLAVLRASLEALSYRFEPRDPREAQLTSAIAQVARIQHNLQTVLDAEHPVPLRPLACTLIEIVNGAVLPLVSEHRARTLVAVEGGSARIVVDGPLVSRTIMRLVESALDLGSEPVLLRASAHSGQASIAVLRPGAATLARTTHDIESLAELVRAVARRDIERTGGTYSERPAANDSVAIEITFALARASEEAA